MALRSVVLRSPEAAAAPGPRATKVVRVGPPDKKGRAADWAAAILGALLLILTVVLVQVLPRYDPLLPQFRVSFDESQGEGFEASQVHDFTEGSGSVFEFLANVTADNVQSITIRVSFTDDRAESLADRFQIELRNPSGERIEPTELLANPAPIFHGPDQLQFSYEAQAATMTYQFAVNPKPQEQVVQGVREGVTKEQVEAEVAAKVHVATAGQWIVGVTLLEAGDCPLPDPNGDTQFQIACQLDEAQGQDPDDRNSFAVEQFTYTYFTPFVKPLF